MKYAVMSNLEFSVPAHQDSLHNGVLAEIAGKPTWGEVMLRKATTVANTPAHLVIIRFNNKADMEDLFDHIKAKMVLIPVVKGSVNKHLCYHDEGEKPCEIIEEFVK